MANYGLCTKQENNINTHNFMKRLFTLLVAGIIALMAIGCETPEPAQQGDLATPQFSANANENSITVSWAAVEGAAFYEIWLNDGEHEKTDKTVYRFDDLKWNTEYTVSLQAIGAGEKKSAVATTKVTIAERKVPAYREWCPQNGATATAISDNGRYVVGCFDRQGMLIDLDTDELQMFENFDCNDVADNGVIVGATYEDSQSGEAAMYIDGKIVKLDLSDLTTSTMSSYSAVTSDGEYIVGWWWEYDESSYYFGVYGYVVPFAYDVLKDRITVLECGDNIYPISARAAYSVSDDRMIVGAEQSQATMAVVWEDEYTPFFYPAFEYDANYIPTLTFGDLQSRITPNGKYVYSVAKTYPGGAGDVQQPAYFNLETNELVTFLGKCAIGSITAMTNDGIAFLNDVPYYMGTTSYVVDVNSGDTETQTPIVDWLLDEHGLDLYNYIQEGVITIGASADGRTILGIVNTDMGWITYVIDLDGEAMPEI